MSVRLYDTLTRSLKPLAAEDGKRFRFYCCGPTVYDFAHVGNFRTFTLQDLLRRVVEVAQLNPFFVRNITDVDDKTIRRSQEKGVSLRDFTDRWTRQFHEDCDALNLLRPDVEPRATDHIPQQIELIEKLIANGHAYATPDGSVYYKVDSFEPYGKLTHLDRSALQTQSVNSAGEANDADEYTRDTIADFALWKARKPEDGDNFWNSPWGEGRPGWHIECSAMSMEYLGNTIDLHGGGIDLCFPHHENEIAQSEAATGDPFVRHWWHCAHLMVEGSKMSKSLGNFYTLKDVKEMGFSPMALRYALVSGHYRQTLNLTQNGLKAARSALQKIEKATQALLQMADKTPDFFVQLQEAHQLPSVAKDAPGPDFVAHFQASWDSLCGDLNTPASLGALFQGLTAATQAKGAGRESLSVEQATLALQFVAALTYALGLQLELEEPGKDDQKAGVPEDIQQMAEQRWQAKKNRDFAMADQMRDKLKELGWNVLDRKDGYSLEPLS